MEKKEKQALAVLVVAALLIASSALILSYNKNDIHKNPPKPMDRTIHFPKDEGAHDEPSEEWILFVQMNVDGHEMFAWLIWSKDKYDTNSTVIISLVDPSNHTGKTYRTEKSISEEYIYAEDWIDLAFSKRYSGEYFNFKSTDNSTDRYLLSTHSKVEDVSLSMDILLKNERKPTLFAQQYEGGIRYGSLYFGNGTVFGYVQSRFSIEGSISINGTQDAISGKAALLHYWGGAAIQIFEFIYGEYMNKDILSITYYSTGGEKIALEQLYVIYDDYYNLYSSYMGTDIGIHIVNETYTSLEGENYSFYPTSYNLDPTDPTHGRAYAFNWSISTTYDNLNITVNPVSRNQFPSSIIWAGAAYLHGDSGEKGWGFTVENKRYLCSPYVSNIDAHKSQESSGWYLTVSAEVYDSIPVDKIRLVYNSTGGMEGNISMMWDEEQHRWSASTGGFSTGDTVSYAIYVRDSAGAEYISPYLNITF